MAQKQKAFLLLENYAPSRCRGWPNCFDRPAQPNQFFSEMCNSCPWLPWCKHLLSSTSGKLYWCCVMYPPCGIMLTQHWIFLIILWFEAEFLITNSSCSTLLLSQKILKGFISIYSGIVTLLISNEHAKTCLNKLQCQYMWGHIFNTFSIHVLSWFEKSAPLLV